MGLFTKERITFRKPFRIAIRFLIGFVIWTMCVHMHCKRRPNHEQEVIILFLLRSPHWLTHAWLQRAFPKCTRTNHVPERTLCSHVLRIRLSTQITIQNTLYSPFQNAFQKPDLKEFAFPKGTIRLSNRERVRITFRNGFRNAIHFFVNRPNDMLCICENEGKK